jgi:hypothetical protein
LKVPDIVGLPYFPERDLVLKCSAQCREEDITTTYYPESRTLKFTGVVPEESKVIFAPGPMIFTLQGFTNPDSSDDAEFLFTSYVRLSQSDYIIDHISGLTINAE